MPGRVAQVKLVRSDDIGFGADAEALGAADVWPESTSTWMELLFAGILMWRFPATTSTSNAGNAARSVVVANGISDVAGAEAGDFAALCSCVATAGVLAGVAATLMCFL